MVVAHHHPAKKKSNKKKPKEQKRLYLLRKLREAIFQSQNHHKSVWSVRGPGQERTAMGD